jgi:hypothetical protein
VLDVGRVGCRTRTGTRRFLIRVRFANRRVARARARRPVAADPLLGGGARRRRGFRRGRRASRGGRRHRRRRRPRGRPRRIRRGRLAVDDTGGPHAAFRRVGLGRRRDSGLLCPFRSLEHAPRILQRARRLIRGSSRDARRALARGAHRVHSHRRLRGEPERLLPLAVVRSEREALFELLRARLRRLELGVIVRGASYLRRPIFAVAHRARTPCATALLNRPRRGISRKRFQAESTASRRGVRRCGLCGLRRVWCRRYTPSSRLRRLRPPS